MKKINLRIAFFDGLTDQDLPNLDKGLDTIYDDNPETAIFLADLEHSTTVLIPKESIDSLIDCLMELSDDYKLRS